MRTAVAILTMLNLLGAGQGILLACALVAIPRGNRLANRLLAAFVAVTSLQLIGAILFTTRYITAVPHLSRMHHPFLWLSAPLLFLYVRTLTTEQPVARRDAWHLLPAGLGALYLGPFYLQSAAYKIASLTSPEYEQWYYTRHVLAFTQGAIYLWFIVQLVRGYRTSERPTETVLWQLRLLLTAVSVIFAGGVLRLLLRDRSLETNLLIPLGSSLLVYGMAWLALTRPEVLAGAAPPLAKKYERSTLTTERAEASLSRLRQVMEEQQPYKAGDLTLPKLASLLSLSPQHLSQLLNERLQQSFSDFINSYRVAAAQQMLTDPAHKHYSILAVAEEVGFNSKSTFNAAFKKHTGLTPSDFREKSNGLESA